MTWALNSESDWSIEQANDEKYRDEPSGAPGSIKASTSNKRLLSVPGTKYVAPDW